MKIEEIFPDKEERENFISSLEKQRDITEIFQKQYYLKHKYCPKCYSDKHSTTLVAYILNPSEPEKYKDKNKCVCCDCGDIHIQHDRISQEEINNKQK